jgi:hypothetical protein
MTPKTESSGHCDHLNASQRIAMALGSLNSGKSSLNSGKSSLNSGKMTRAGTCSNSLLRPCLEVKK